MFRKRVKKTFPPGTFIPTPARVCAIIQLCLAFSMILWNAGEPFVGELFSLKSRLVLFQDVMGIQSSEDIPLEKQARLTRNAERFQQLPKTQQKQIITGYQGIQKELQRTFFDKIKRAIHLIVFEIPLFEQAWLLLSIIIPLMLLKRIEGAAQAIWLLPLLTFCYAVDSRLHTKMPPSKDAQLFPSEQVIVQDYLQEPLSDNIFEQQAQLIQGWKLYLVKDWASQVPSKDSIELDRQAELGEFAFNAKRTELIAENPHKIISQRGQTQESMFVLALYLFWNIFLAYTAWRYCGSSGYCIE